MVLFNVTAEIQKLAEPVSPGWHKLELKKIEDKTQDNGVKLTTFTFVVFGDGDPDAGKYIWNRVTHDENMRYSLDFLRLLARDIKLDRNKGTNIELTTQNAVKQIEANIVQVDVEGRIMNNIRGVRAIGSADKAKK